MVTIRTALFGVHGVGSRSKVEILQDANQVI